MKEPKEPIWVYDVKFSVDTIHTRETIKAYGRDMAKKLLVKKYSGCEIKIYDVIELRRELWN